MANPYCTGPVPIWVGVGAGSDADDNTPFFLGWFERGLNDFHIDPKYQPIFADIYGSLLPYDHMFMGEDGWCSGDLSVWNEAVYARCVARPTSLLSPGRGSLGPTDLGSLMQAENLAFPIWLPFPYSAPKATPLPGAPNGYRFPQAWFFGPDHIIGGLQQSKRRIVCYFAPLRNESTGAIKLYDPFMTQDGTSGGTALPAIPPSAATGAIPS
jgi:hypothetical protein